MKLAEIGSQSKV